jgi:hypothetical protein
MKPVVAFLILLAGAASGAAAQRRPDPLYWVVEANVKCRNYSVIRFYDSNNVLIHEVKQTGTYIDVRKRRQRKKLDHLLKAYSKQEMIATINSHRRALEVKPVKEPSGTGDF